MPLLSGHGGSRDVAVKTGLGDDSLTSADVASSMPHLEMKIVGFAVDV